MTAPAVEGGGRGQEHVDTGGDQADGLELAGRHRGQQGRDDFRHQEEDDPVVARLVHEKACRISEQMPAMMKAPGMVSTQAHTTRPATPQRTADSRWEAPTPTMAPVMVWVVDTGMPDAEAKNRVLAAADSAASPPTGCSRVMREPIVFTMRQPPVSVPSAMAVWAPRTTHSGTPAAAGRCPVVISTARITPIVFWASFTPWPRLKAAADTSCPRRKPRLSACNRRTRWNTHMMPRVTISPRASPI